VTKTSQIREWSPVPHGRYQQALQAEHGYWSNKDPQVLNLRARDAFYAGYYEWTRHGNLCDPFRVSASSLDNFHIPAAEMEGSRVLDVGCGPASRALSLVHCARVYAVDPLIDAYREMQPFGWDRFEAVYSVGAEELPFEDGSFDYAYCRNVLDHTQDADAVLSEITRVLLADGQLLLNCDTRDEAGGGEAHPYAWTTETLEARIFAEFDPVTPIALFDYSELPDVDRLRPGQLVRWVCRLRRKTAL
jgi:SAM-dependent methyltransferase